MIIPKPRKYREVSVIKAMNKDKDLAMDILDFIKAREKASPEPDVDPLDAIALMFKEDWSVSTYKVLCCKHCDLEIDDIVIDVILINDSNVTFVIFFNLRRCLNSSNIIKSSRLLNKIA